MRLTTHAADETSAAGRDLAQTLRAGDVVLLVGPLGSGKTTFVQGIADGLGASASATSPSFVIVNEYAIASRQQTRLETESLTGQAVGRRETPHDALPTTRSPAVLRHIDLYRLPNPTRDLDRLGLPELLADPDAITVIEWGDRLPRGMLPAGHRVRTVRFATGEAEAARVLTIEK